MTVSKCILSYGSGYISFFNTYLQIYTSIGLNVSSEILSNHCVEKIYNDTVPLVANEWYPGISYMLNKYL